MPAPFWARPSFVLSAIAVYLAVHFAIRLAMGPGLSVDDAEQTLFSQHYAWTYRYRAPPLFTWMLVTLGTIVPVGVTSIAVLRYLLLGVLYGFFYLSARRLLADPRLAALSVFSFAALGTFAEAVHRNLTHSTTLAALVAVAWYVFLRLAAAPHIGWYLALGAVFGLGILAKWNFVLFAVALPAACLLRRESRGLVLTGKTLVAAAVAAAIVTPTVLAAIAMGPPPGEDVRSVLNATGGPGLAAIAEGTIGFIDAVIVYVLPFLPLALILFALPLWRGVRAGPNRLGAVRNAPFQAPPDRCSPALVGATIVIGLALIWAFVPILGATEFRLRYLYPVMLILPAWLIMLIERGRPSGRTIALFAMIMAAFVVFVVGKRTGMAAGSVDCGLCLEMQPYDRLAQQLRQAGYSGTGTIIGAVGANLRPTFTEARIIDPAYAASAWPAPSGNGPCLVVWPGPVRDGRIVVPPAYASYIETTLQGSLDAPHQDGVISAPMHPPAQGEVNLRYRLYAGPNGDCR